MKKEFLEKAIEVKLKKYAGGNRLGELLNYLIEFIDDYINPENIDVWLFQNYKSIETDYLMSSKDTLFEFIIENIESYFNFYINIEKEDIEPVGIADIWISFEVSDKSKELILRILNEIKENLTDLSELTDIKEIIDTRLPLYHDDFLDNIEIVSSKVIITK